MRVLVTGGAGFIGSAVCRYFVGERGATVLNVDKLTHTSSLASLSTIAASPRYSLRKVDVCDRARIGALIQAFEPDAIVHLAAAAPGSSTDTLIVSNVIGTGRLFEAAHDYWSGLTGARRERFRILNVSGVEHGARPETSHEAASKAAAEQFAGSWQTGTGMPVLLSRGVATYGPRQFPDQAIPNAILAAMDGDAVSVHDAGDVRDWLHVDDHVRALDAILAKGTPGEIYHVGTGAARPSQAVADRIVELVERHARKDAHRLARFRGKGDVSSSGVVAVAGSEKLERDTGWKPEESFEMGLSKTVRWYLDNPSWWGPLREARRAGDRHGLLRIA